MSWECLNGIWRDACSPPDTREIWEFAAEEVQLPSAYARTGTFDSSDVPFVEEPMRALRDPMVREVVAMSGVQCLKTLIGELWILWLIKNNPGPTQWLHPTNEEAGEHAKERFLSLIEACPAVHKFFTGRIQDNCTTFIKFLHMYLRMEGAAEKGNLQRKSIQNQMCSEIWQSEKWTPGKLGEAATRLTQFVHNSKRYIESQPGWDHEYKIDDMHPAYLEGTQEVWNFRCLKCGFYQPFLWSFRRPDGSRAGMRWEDSEKTRLPSGEWRWSELVPTIRYECIKCGHGHTDDPITRRRMSCRENTKYVVTNEQAPTSKRTFNWNQLAVPGLSWFETKTGGVKKFLEAREEANKGNLDPQRDFFMKVIAQAYDPSKFGATQTLPTIEINSRPEAKVWKYEGIVFDRAYMSVDVQMDHMWVLVQAWSLQGDSVTLWFGKLLTWQDIELKQAEYEILDEHVCVDSRHRTREVYLECVRHGRWVSPSPEQKIWYCWKAFQGSDRPDFTWIPRKGPQKGKQIKLPYSWPPNWGDPCIGKTLDDPIVREFRGRTCPIITWSNGWIKDVAKARRDGHVKVKVLTANGPWNEEFNNHLYSETIKRFARGTGHGIDKWALIGHRKNHGWDAFCMLIVRAFMDQRIGAQSSAPESKKTPEVPGTKLAAAMA